MAANRFALLLDVDGVIIRDRPLLKHVGQNCTKFIQTTYHHPLRTHVADMMNHNLYKEHGHTLRGLNTTGFQYKDFDRNQLHTLFHEFVYNDFVLDHLDTYLESKEFVKSVEGFVGVGAVCASANLPVCLFSNAPQSWCEPIAEAFTKVSGMSLHSVLSSTHPVMSPYLKPDMETYTNIAQHIKASTNGIQHMMFIDDSLTNLLPIAGNPAWTPVLFSQDVRPWQTQLHAIDSVDEIPPIISHKVHEMSLMKPKKCHVILHHSRVENLNTLKKILQSCVPSLTHFMIEQITINVNIEGIARVACCPEPQAIEISRCLIENGLVVTVEDA